MVATLVILGAAVGFAGGMPHLALLRGGSTSARVSLGLAATMLSFLGFTGITALVARSVGRGVVYFAGALALAFLATVTASGLATARRLPAALAKENS